MVIYWVVLFHYFLLFDSRVTIELEEQLVIPAKNVSQTIHVIACELILGFLVVFWTNQEYESHYKTSVKSVGLSFNFLLSLSCALGCSFLCWLELSIIYFESSLLKPTVVKVKSNNKNSRCNIDQPIV